MGWEGRGLDRMGWDEMEWDEEVGAGTSCASISGFPSSALVSSCTATEKKKWRLNFE